MFNWDDLPGAIVNEHAQVDRVDILVDAIDFPWAGFILGHCGEHIETLRYLATDVTQVKYWANFFRERVKAVDGDPRVVVLCDNGKIRSVTLCRFFIHLAKTHGFHVVGPWHLQKHRWDNDEEACCCDCPGCDVANPEKADLFPDWA